MSRKASDIADRVRARLPQPSGELDDLLLPTSPRLVAVPGAETADEAIASASGGAGGPEEGSGGGADPIDVVVDVHRDSPGDSPSSPGGSTSTDVLGAAATAPERRQRRTVAASPRRTGPTPRGELVERLVQGQPGWEVPSVWRSRHDVRSIGYDVPGPLALAFVQAKLDLERESGRRLSNEDLVHPALEALSDDPAVVAAELSRMGPRVRATGGGQRLTAYVSVDLKHKLEDLALALYAREGLRVHKGALWALAVTGLLEDIGIPILDTIGPARPGSGRPLDAGESR